MRKTCILLLFILAAGFSQAQDSEITDEHLKTYAIIELAVQTITSEISPMVSTMIAEQNERIENPEDKITNNRWKELTETDGDPDEMAAINAKEWEVQFFNLVNKQIDKKKNAASTVLKTMVANTLGASTYRQIKNSLATDPELRQKYSEIKSRCE